MTTEGPGGILLPRSQSFPASNSVWCFGRRKDWELSQRPHTSHAGAYRGSLDIEGSRGSGKLKINLSPSHRWPMCLWLSPCFRLKMHVTKLLSICKEGVVGNNEHAIGLEIDLSGFKDYCLLGDGTHITISQFSYDIINLLCKDFIARLVHLSKIRETQNPIRKLTFQAGLAFT